MNPPILSGAPSTEYVVLRLDYFGDGSAANEKPAWTEVATTQARSPQVAIRTIVGNPLDKDFREGQYVAVPARSWNPVNVKPKVVQSVTLEDAP